MLNAATVFPFPARCSNGEQIIGLPAGASSRCRLCRPVVAVEDGFRSPLVCRGYTTHVGASTGCRCSLARPAAYMDAGSLAFSVSSRWMLSAQGVWLGPGASPIQPTQKPLVHRGLLLRRFVRVVNGGRHVSGGGSM